MKKTKTLKEVQARKQFKENLGATALCIFTYAFTGLMAGFGVGAVLVCCLK